MKVELLNTVRRVVLVWLMVGRGILIGILDYKVFLRDFGGLSFITTQGLKVKAGWLVFLIYIRERLF